MSFAPVEPAYPVTPATSGKAITSLVLGILSLFTCITGIPAAILGFMALGDIKRQPRRIGGKGMAIAGIVTGLCGMVFSTIFFFLIPALAQVGKSAQRAQATNQMRQIVMAALIYESAHHALPNDIMSADGEPLLSWRVAILPFIERQDLYAKFKLNEPWNSPHNLALVKEMPQIYAIQDPRFQQGATPYLMPYGPDALKRPPAPGAKGVTFGEIRDGASNTALLVEVDPEQAVIWTKPDDLPIDFDQPRRGLGNVRSGGFLAAFCDGSVEIVGNDESDAVVAALFTPDGAKKRDEPPGVSWNDRPRPK